MCIYLYFIVWPLKPPVPYTLCSKKNENFFCRICVSTDGFCETQYFDSVLATFSKQKWSACRRQGCRTDHDWQLCLRQADNFCLENVAKTESKNCVSQKPSVETQIRQKNSHFFVSTVYVNVHFWCLFFTNSVFLSYKISWWKVAYANDFLLQMRLYVGSASLLYPSYNWLIALLIKNWHFSLKNTS